MRWPPWRPKPSAHRVSNPQLVREWQTACARAGEILACAPFDNGDVDLRQRELSHDPGLTASPRECYILKVPGGALSGRPRD
jgi:hypothetical protein